MEITQVIVAYRNPFEMWIWESGAIYAILIPVAVLACAIFSKMLIKIINR